MSATSASRGRRLVATALAKAEAFLLEPVESVARPAPITLRPVVAAVALAPGCGTTTVARALAVELATRDSVGAAVAAGGETAGPPSLAGAHAGRLARAIRTGSGERVRATGRLCLVEDADAARLAGAVRHLAPLVLDIGHGEPAGATVSVADHVVLVAEPTVEPALGEAVALSLGRIGPPPIIALNRAADGPEVDRWRGRSPMLLPRSAAGARLALAGHGPRGALGEGVAELAGHCSAARSEW